VLHIAGQGKPTQEVGEIVSQSEQLQPYLVILERAAGELRPLDGVLAFLEATASVTWAKKVSIDPPTRALRSALPKVTTTMFHSGMT
jgi:hypothetical protein